MKSLHALLLEYVKSRGPQTEEARRFYKNMSAKDLMRQLEAKDPGLTDPDDAQYEYYVSISDRFGRAVLRKRGEEKLILGVERRGQELDKLLSETLPPILARNQMTVAQIQKATPSENLPETQMKNEILIEKKREDSVTAGMEGLSLGPSSTELHVSQIRLFNDRSSGIKEYKDGDENDHERNDLGGSSKRQWAEFYDREGNLLHDRVIVEFKELPPTAFRDDKRLNAVRLQLRSLVRELRLASRRIPNAKPFQVLHCLGFYDTEQGGYGIVYLPPPANTYTTCESLGNILLRDDYKRLLEEDMDNRLNLAKALAFTVYSLHSVQWVHKSFNPDNVLLFGRVDNGQVKFDWTSPYVVGFDASRSNLAHSDKIPTSIRWENRVYAHPHRQKNGDAEIKRFSKEYDIYSLGVVLLEIGLMKCFKHSDYRKSKEWTDIPAQDVQNKLLSLAEGELRKAPGKSYSGAVVTCLNGFFLSEFAHDDPAGTGLLAAFRSKVCEIFDQVRF